MTFKLKHVHKILLFLVIVTTIVSCYKKQDTIVIITVRDSISNDLVVGASVRLRYDTAGNPNPPRIDVTASTNPQGQAVFNFNELYQSGQAGFAVLDVLLNGTKVDVIQIEEEVTTEETLYL
tara:strand:- start:963 stop:1328 length:366 start_codon:yes stop_codon:yes gene_type:complete